MDILECSRKKKVTSPPAGGDFFEALAFKESSGRLDVVGDYGYVGKYQFGAMALEDAGYLKKGTSKSGNAAMNNPANRTGLNGINSVEQYKANESAQDDAANRNAEMNYRILVSKGVITDSTSFADIQGFLGAAHLLGAGGVSKGLSGVDGNGISGKEYFDYFKANALS